MILVKHNNDRNKKEHQTQEHYYEKDSRHAIKQ
jgi:hypothetical protein